MKKSPSIPEDEITYHRDRAVVFRRVDGRDHEDDRQRSDVFLRRDRADRRGRFDRYDQLRFAPLVTTKAATIISIARSIEEQYAAFLCGVNGSQQRPVAAF